MSRNYEIAVEINGFDMQRVLDIEDACNDVWGFDDAWTLHRGNPCGMLNSAEGRLCGGESESEFADRLAAAVWRANGGPCRVEVRATCLEYLPYETYVPKYDPSVLETEDDDSEP